MTDRIGECSQIKVGIIFVLGVVMGHISMSETMNSDIVSQANLLTYLSMSLAGTATDTTAEGEFRRAADILMFRRIASNFSLIILFADFCSGPV